MSSMIIKTPEFWVLYIYIYILDHKSSREEPMEAGDNSQVSKCLRVRVTATLQMLLLTEM
jgi:hypothetical protein